MSLAVALIAFISMALFTASVLVVGVMLAAGLLPRHPHHHPRP